MSFSNNCTNSDKIPGPLRGNPTNGLCEKTCIEVKKVFDACMKQETRQNVSLSMKITSQGKYEAPYTFVSGKSNQNTKITDLKVTPSIEDSCFARVSCNIQIHIDIVFTDKNGLEGVGVAILTIPKDVMLHISAPSIIPYQIEALASAVCPDAVFVDGTFLMASLCITTILKVVMPVDILVPSYGYCYIPPCQEYTEEVCDGVFDLPLFPQECGVEGRCINNKCN